MFQNGNAPPLGHWTFEIGACLVIGACDLVLRGK
jgi:hypothetical protein